MMNVAFLLVMILSTTGFAKDPTVRLENPNHLVPVNSFSDFRKLRDQLNFTPLRAYRFYNQKGSNDYLYVDTRYSNIRAAFDSKEMGFFYISAGGSITQLIPAHNMEISRVAEDVGAAYVVQFPESSAVASLRFFTPKAWWEKSTMTIKGKKWDLNMYSLVSLFPMHQTPLEVCEGRLARTQH